jgi:acetyltransferase-like isoleucine patch superfamily enzyme
VNDASSNALRFKGKSLVRKTHTVKVKCEQPIVFTDQINFAGYATVTIGGYTYFRNGTVRSPVTIGRFCSIGPDVCIGEANHPVDWLSSSPFQYSPVRFKASNALAGFIHRKPTADELPRVMGRPVSIGHDVWIGAGVIVNRGVNIGHGAILGSGAVVTKDVPPYAIMGGVPAKVIRFRFSEKIVARLLEAAWWNYDPMGLSGIDFADVERALDAIEQRRAAGTLQPFVAQTWFI